MKYAVSGNDMKCIDDFTINVGNVPALTLMERAATGVCDELIRDCINPRDVQFLLVCGKGNNGADGVAMARMLSRNGLDVKTIVVGIDKLPEVSVFESTIDSELKGLQCTKEWIYQYKEALNVSVNFLCYEEGILERLYKNSSKSATVIVDAMIGVGLKSSIRGQALRVTEEINSIRHKNEINILEGRYSRNFYVYGVDVPSGAGFEPEIICDKVVTFGCMKKEMLTEPGCRYIKGKPVNDKHICIEENVVIKNIGFLSEAFENVDIINLIEDKDIAKLPERDIFGNKGTFGKVYVMAGSYGMCGAAVFSAKAAYRTGAGLVKIFSHKENVTVYQTLLPEAVLSVYDDCEHGPNDTYALNNAAVRNKQIIKDIKWSDVVVLGPGLGTGEESVSIVRLAFETAKKYNKPLIIDADGLNVISEHRELTELYYEGVIITPHAGEMSRLLHTDIKSVKEDIVNVARKYAIKHKITVVLKDARTVITNGEDTYINSSGHSGMAKGGSGDILAGIIAGIKAVYGVADKNKHLRSAIAEENNSFLSAIACYVHGKAAEKAAENRREGSIIATDIIDGLCKVNLP